MTSKFIDRTAELSTDAAVLRVIANLAYNNKRYAHDKRDVKFLPPDVEAEAMRIWTDPTRQEANFVHGLTNVGFRNPARICWGQTTVYEVYNRKDLPTVPYSPYTQS